MKLGLIPQFSLWRLFQFSPEGFLKNELEDNLNWKLK